MYKDGTCSSTTSTDGIVTRDACPDAYGMVLGTNFPSFCHLPLDKVVFLAQEHPLYVPSSKLACRSALRGF